MRRNEHSLILASQSKARHAMLTNAGLVFKTIHPVLDEMAVAKEMLDQKAAPQKIALELAKKKALTVARKNPDMLVIGSDQVLVLDGKMLGKAHSEDEARARLKLLRGRTHTLISTVAVAKAGAVFWSHEEEATLAMHDFDDAFLDLYCGKAGEALTHTVGAYEIEGAGAWLLSGAKGDYFTILGMPLLPLLAYLREYHSIGP